MSLLASRRVVLCLAFVMAASPLPVLAADGPAATLIEKTSAEVIQLIKTTTGAQREAGIRKVLEASFDLNYMGQQALGKISARPNGVTVVDSRLNQSNGQPIKIEWEVRDSGGAPRITDVKIEGVSMVITRRTDFTSYIQNNGGKVEALIQELESRAQR